MSRRTNLFNSRRFKNIHGIPSTMTKKAILEAIDADFKSFYGADTKVSRKVRKLDVFALRRIYQALYLFESEPIALRISVVESNIEAEVERHESYSA